MRNIDMKLHHLVQIWAPGLCQRLSEKERSGCQSDDELPVEMVRWQARIDSKAWRGSRLGWSVPEPDIARGVITVWMLCRGRNRTAGRVITASGATSRSEARSLRDLIANDNWLGSKHERGERWEKATRHLQCSYSKKQVHDVMFLKSNRARSKHMKVQGQLETDLTWQVWL